MSEGAPSLSRFVRQGGDFDLTLTLTAACESSVSKLSAFHLAS
jgi:hypothetical protein